MKRFLISLWALLAMAIAALAATPAEYPGGKEAMDKYLADNLQYPPAAKANGIEGVVPVSFIVKTDGSISTIKIVRLIDPDLEQESIRLVKGMPKWQPATDDAGKPVDSTEQIQIVFQLPGD